MVENNFKQTEIGFVPEDWAIVVLSSISTLKGRIGWQGLTQKEFITSSDEPFLITGMNFKDGKIRWNEVYHVSKERYDVAKDIQLITNDILMTKDGTIGKLLYVDKIPYPHKATLNSHLLLFRPIYNSYIPKYLYYNLQFKFFLKHIDDNKSGSTFFGISQEAVGKYNVLLPSILEQQAIAETLTDTDEWIESLEKLIVKKRLMKQGAIQKLLTPKAGWEIKSLNNFLLKDPDYGINAASVIFNPNLPVYLRITDFDDDGKFNRKNRVSVSNRNSELYFLTDGDICIARTGASVGKSYYYDKKVGPLVFAGFLIRLRFDTKFLTSKFFFYVTKSNVYKHWIESNSMRSGQPGINSNELKSFEFFYPKSLIEQNRIVKILSDMDSEIEVLEHKLGKVKKIKQGMMQELLTGRIRLIGSKTKSEKAK